MEGTPHFGTVVSSRPEGGELGTRKRSSSSSRNSTETTKGTEPLAFEQKNVSFDDSKTAMKKYRYLLDPNKIGKIRLGESSDLCSSSTRSCFGCRNILVIANLYSLYIYIDTVDKSIEENPSSSIALL